MGFIQKNDPLVINIKLTTKGRELLSKGQLRFSKFGIGDSEIDYEFMNDTSINPVDVGIMKAKDKNPSIISFITKNISGETLNTINDLSSVSFPSEITNTAPNYGFFDIANSKFLTDPNHVKQPDGMVYISGVTGGTIINIKQAPTYGNIFDEPEIDDYVLIKWTNPNHIDTTGHTINYNQPVPNLFYKIETIVGSLQNNNLTITVDRELPTFSGDSTNVAAVLFYDNKIQTSGNTINSTDFVADSVLSFIENCQVPITEVPFWNMSIIFTNEIEGVKTNNKKYGNFVTSKYGGFVSYIQNQSKKHDRLGIIHYTNDSPANTYGEGFYNTTPILDLPTIMWHKSTDGKQGVRFICDNIQKKLNGLNINYYDLKDSNNNIIGKVFKGLKIFTIEDQELLFAMSYKSNRSWTLPEPIISTDKTVNFGCAVCAITADITVETPDEIGGLAAIKIDNIQNTANFDAVDNNEVLIKISDTLSNIKYITIAQESNIIQQVGQGNYIIDVIDTGAPNCSYQENVIINDPTSLLDYYDYSINSCGIINDFGIRKLSFYDQNAEDNFRIIAIDQNLIGTYYGNVSVNVVNASSKLNTDFTITSGFQSGQIRIVGSTVGTAINNNVVISIVEVGKAKDWQYWDLSSDFTKFLLSSETIYEIEIRDTDINYSTISKLIRTNSSGGFSTIGNWIPSNYYRIPLVLNTFITYKIIIQDTSDDQTCIVERVYIPIDSGLNETFTIQPIDNDPTNIEVIGVGNSIGNIEYSLFETGQIPVEWQSSNEFNNLEQNKNYSIAVRSMYGEYPMPTEINNLLVDYVVTDLPTQIGCGLNPDFTITRPFPQTISIDGSTVGTAINNDVEISIVEEGNARDWQYWDLSTLTNFNSNVSDSITYEIAIRDIDVIGQCIVSKLYDA